MPVPSDLRSSVTVPTGPGEFGREMDGNGASHCGLMSPVVPLAVNCAGRADHGGDQVFRIAVVGIDVGDGEGLRTGIADVNGQTARNNRGVGEAIDGAEYVDVGRLLRDRRGVSAAAVGDEGFRHRAADCACRAGVQADVEIGGVGRARREVYDLAARCRLPLAVSETSRPAAPAPAVFVTLTCWLSVAPTCTLEKMMVVGVLIFGCAAATTEVDDF